MSRSPQIPNNNLRKRLKEMGLREDSLGYWYLDSFSKHDWLITSYVKTVKVCKKIIIANNGDYMTSGLTEEIDCYNEDEVISALNKLLKQIQNINFKIKQLKLKNKLKAIKEDFKWNAQAKSKKL